VEYARHRASAMGCESSLTQTCAPQFFAPLGAFGLSNIPVNSSCLALTTAMGLLPRNSGIPVLSSNASLAYTVGMGLYRQVQEM